MGHDHDDPFLEEEGAIFWSTWAPVLESGLASVSEAMLDAAKVGPGSRVLDLACGLGHATMAAVARGAQTTGLDLNPHMLERATRAEGVRYVQGDMMQPPAGPWDAVVSRFGAHHADPAWLQAAIDVLAPGGRVAIAEWSPETALFDVEGEDVMMTEDRAEDWVVRFEAAGLDDITTSTVAFTLDFGSEERFLEFIDVMDQGASRHGAPGGKQVNEAYVVSGRR